MDRMLGPLHRVAQPLERVGNFGGGPPGSATKDPATGLYNNNLATMDPALLAGIRAYDPNYGKVPSGYEFNAGTGGYDRSPGAAGSRVGQFESGAYNSGPLSGLIAAGGGTGGSGGTGGAGGGGTTGARPTVGWPGGGSMPMGTISSSPTEGVGGAPGSGGNSATNTQNAAFATAKDQVGQQSRGAVNSLNDELASQGLSGSGAQVQGTKDIIAHGAEDLAKTSSDLATKSAENAITTRGQDIGQQESQYSGQIQQRGQDIQAEQARATLAMQKQLASMGLLQQAMQGLTGAGASFQY